MPQAPPPFAVPDIDSGIGIPSATPVLLPWLILFCSIIISACCCCGVCVYARATYAYDCDTEPDEKKVGKKFYKEWEDACKDHRLRRRTRIDDPSSEQLIGLMARDPHLFAS